MHPPTLRDQVWVELGAELTPAKSLARVDTVTARTVTTVTVLGVRLTGLGTLSTLLPTVSDLARALAMAAVISAALAVASGLIAQVLTISHHLNVSIHGSGAAEAG